VYRTVLVPTWRTTKKQCFVRTRKEKRQHAMWVKDFWMLQLFANVRLSELQSDLVNYMRIDIDMFEELFCLVETQNTKKLLPYTTSYIFQLEYI